MTPFDVAAMNPPSEQRLNDLASHIFKGGTIVDFAREVGRTPRSVYRWAASPSMGERIATLRREHLARASNRLSEAGRDAVETLVRLLDAGSPQDSVRLGAARAILSSLVGLSAIAELQDKLQALEERLHGGTRRP